MLWVLVLGAILIWAPSPTITHRMTPERGRTQIKPKPCSVNGVEGTCMFVYECIKTDGKHVGMCVDNFMFGSCCSHNSKHNDVLPHHHSHHHHHHHQSNPNLLFSSSSIYSSLRPPNLTLSGRPQSNKLRPSKPVGFVTHPTKKPATSHNWFKEPNAMTMTTTRTTTMTSQKQVPAVKPWTMRPQTFVTSSEDTFQKPFSETKFPTGNESNESLLIVPINSSPTEHQISTPAATAAATSGFYSSFTSSYDLVAMSRPSTPTINSTFRPKNKTYILSTSLTTRTTTTAKATVATTTTTRPMPSETKPSGIAWSTPKPAWVGSPPANHLLPSSKPLPQLSKPDYWMSEKPGFVTSLSSWSATSEPHFVTRPRPTSNLWMKPKPTRKPISHIVSGASSTRSNLTSSDRNNSVGHSGTMTTTSKATLLATLSATDSKSPITTTEKSKMTTTTTTTTTRTTTEATTSSTTGHSKLSKYQYSGQCGVPALSPRPEMRIVGGKNAPFGGWPWQVSVRRTSFFGFSSTHRCGGAVINENWIATAGHCVDDLLTSQIRIRVGEYDFSSVQEPYPFIERGASKKVVHPKYNFFTYEYDLALVRLESPLEFQPHISPICLPASDDLLIGENATVTGWGRLSEGGTLPSVLQQASVPIVSNDKCKSMFLRAGRHEFIPEIFLCAGYENGGQDSCQGDSGGPLQVKGKNGRYFLAGIISWGIGCAEANLPGVCTRISKFVPWILENVT